MASLEHLLETEKPDPHDRDRASEDLSRCKVEGWAMKPFYAQRVQTLRHERRRHPEQDHKS